ncbi:MAG: DHH family phosphoesterase [Bacteroidales bacterium]|nr:DHH family phosphoesterase [Bacteroidales bacterium]
MIVPHVNPDGDAIGASMAIYHFFRKYCNTNVVLPSAFPDFLSWIPNAQKCINAKKDPQKAKKIIENSDLIFIIDHNAPDRSGDLESLIADSNANKLMIDHHPNPQYPVNYEISCTQVSSTCELSYNFLQSIDVNAVDKTVAECLYVGLMTDTGNFVHNVHPDTFRIVSELIDLGIDRDNIYDKVFNNFSLERMQLLGFALLNRTEVIKELGVSITSLSKEDLRKFNFQVGDSEGFVNVMLSAAEVKSSILILEKDHEIKLSFRSKAEIPINTIAVKYFSGGGHRNAAGGSQQGMSLDETILKLKKVLNEEQHLLTNNPIL